MRRVIPVVLIDDGRVIKTTRFKNPRYIGDPLVICKIFEEKEADEILVLDIGATAKSEIDFELISSLVEECFVPMAYGGGISNIAQVDRLIRCGVDKVVINSHLHNNLGLVKEINQKYGSQVIIAGIDFRADFFGRPKMAVCNGKRKLKAPIKRHIADIVAEGVGELLLTDIDKEGSMTGFNIELLRDLIGDVDIPVIITGGAGSKSHIIEVFDDLDVSAVGCGSFFVYSGARKGILVTYENVVD